MEIEICYSPSDALEIARNNPGKEVVFLSLGFETTAPAEAVTVMQAKSANIRNFSLLCGNKITVPAVKALLDSGDARIDGFILPGHVSTVIGSDAWNFIADDYRKPGVVAGFEAGDLLRSTLTIIDLILKDRMSVINDYTRAAKKEGNTRALDIMLQAFKPSDSIWRGIGVIPESGLVLKDEYSDYDAEKKFPVTPPAPRKDTGCRCGEVLRGIIIPTECPLFGKACVPEHPVGPCMVSSEGPCSAYYLYGK